MLPYIAVGGEIEGISRVPRRFGAIIWPQNRLQHGRFPGPMLPQKTSMIRICILALIAFLPALPGKAELPDGWLGSLDVATGAARSEDRLILVDLYADWCGWCKRLEQEVYSTDEFREFSKDLVLLRVDTEDAGEGSRLKRRYGVYSLPTTLILDPDLVEVGKVEGFAPVVSYIRKIERRIASFSELQEGFERFSKSSDPRALSTLASEFHQRSDGIRAAELYRQLLSLEVLQPNDETWTRYQLSDALRIGRQFEAAQLELERARAEALLIGQDSLVPRLDLLAADIALDRGDCEQARREFEAFLGSHPKGEMRRHAKQGLASIKGDSSLCT